MYSKVLDSALIIKEAVEMLYSLIFNTNGDSNVLIDRFNELKFFLHQIDKFIKEFKESFQNNQIAPIIENLVFYFDVGVEYASQGQMDKLQFLHIYYFYPLCRVLLNDLVMCCATKVDKNLYPELYTEPVFDKKAIRSDENRSCQVSIVLLAYNKVEYTKKAVESILKYTDDVDFELILVNNGSNDETKEYFDSIQGAVPIHLKENIHAGPGFNVGIFAASGKYTACVCNDFIFTHNWLKNLLTCIESDENIGFVSPVSSYISNLQQVNLSFSNDKEMHRQAKKYNVSNPNKWERKTRLLPNVLMCPTDLLQGLNGYAQDFIYGEFADDDISYRICRSGFEQVLCKDTWVHHFGHITTQTTQIENHSLEVSREWFKEKWGFDAWGELLPDFELTQCSEVVSNYVKGKHIRILAINTGVGGTALELKNKILKKDASSVDIYHFTTDTRFLSGNGVVYYKELWSDSPADIIKAFSGIQFDYVVLGKDLADSDFDHTLFAWIKDRVSQDGTIFLSVKNAGYWGNIINILKQNIGTSDNPTAKIYGLQSLIQMIVKQGFKIHINGVHGGGNEKIIMALAEVIHASPDISQHFALQRYIINCRKK